MKTFKKVYIEITNICNLECDFCPKTKRKPKFMSIDMFSNILDQIKPHTDYIYLHVKGEPLLHPELDKLLDISHDKGFFVNITTNGTLISKTANILLSKLALRQINISLHSLDGNKSFEDRKKYIQDILNFTKLAVEKTEMIISLRLWNLNEDASDTKIRKNNAILENIESFFNLSYKIEETSKLARGMKIADRLYINQAEKFKWPDVNENEINKNGFCYGLRTQAAILVDGTVVPCCLDSDGIINLGNIQNNFFSEIIESERANNIVNGFSNKQAIEELCQRCGYIKRFK
ncbi:MAG TPA: radical SAM/SPASM domain-containing protein [Clostridia bacterium]|nr:MAG: pyrroloquinoline quinone biosynthesis protein PqqE [Firmicutes bacterium ADurb.Bin146]HOD92261.1 radical SAM/SPASM domain-containing protein [Clostridia bacterium]HQM38740.1 radical SAM/SPASM domain-containing protein [Clostridia bacterium]